MSAKRPAEQAIDQKTHQYIDNNDPPKPSTSDPVDRVILQVKRDETPTPKPTPSNQQAPAPSQDNDKKQKPTQKPSQKPKPLFSNLFQNSNGNGVGLFGSVGIFTAANNGLLASTSSSQAPKIDLKSSNLFNGNGFTAKPASSTPNMFGSMLGGLGSGPSIFGFGQGASIPPVRNGEEEDEGDSAELQKVQSMQVDRSKSKGHYDYKAEVQVLFSGAARKYKKNNGDLVENVEVVVQHDEPNKLVYIIVRLAATKHSIFTGFILQGKSEVRVLNKKDQNLQIGAFVIAKNKPTELDRLKIQLDTPENGKLLFTKLQAAIAGKLSSAQPQGGKQKPSQLKQKKEQKPQQKQQPNKQQKHQSNKQQKQAIKVGQQQSKK